MQETKSEKPGKQDRYCGFDRQDAFTEVHERETCFRQFLNLIGDEASFGTDSESHRTIDIPGAGIGGWRMGGKSERVPGKTGKFVLHKGFEPRAKLNVRHLCVPGLFEAERQFVQETFRYERWTRPVTLLHTIDIQQDDSLHAHCCCRFQDALQNLGAGKCENERDRERVRRLSFEENVHFER